MTAPFNGGLPTKIGSRSGRLDFWGQPRSPGDPQINTGTITLTDAKGDIVLDVFIGPPGIPGEPMPPWRIEWDSTITDSGDLPSVATLDESDDGRAWVIGTLLWVYVHHLGGYRTLDAGIPGPPGLTPDVSASAEVVAAANPDNTVGTIVVDESGPSTAPHFHFKIPGLRGPAGPTTAIRSAPDYDNTLPPQDGQGVVWDEEAEKFKLGDLSPNAATMTTISHASFIPYTGGAGRQLIASLDVPARAAAWYPDILGHLRWQRTLLSSAQVEVEVRIGDTGIGTGETDPLCGLAPYDPSTLDAVTIAHIMTHFSDTGNPTRSVSEDSATGRVPAGQAKTIYVFLHKIGGLGSYQFTNDTAQLRLLEFPVS